MAGNLDDQRYIISYAFRVGSQVIERSSKNQITMSLSSSEAQYQELCMATSEAISLRRLIDDVGEEKIEETIIKMRQPEFH